MHGEQASPAWKKIKRDFERRVIEICDTNASILFNEETPTYRNFRAFCERRLIQFPNAKPAEVFTFLVLVHCPSLNSARQLYSEWTEREITAQALQAKARRVRNKVLKYLESYPGLKEELGKILDSENDNE